ncbi:MAG: N-acetyltransferase, partial [Rhodobacteraceae bacterium]|nr:N-acetyltransferase [Paracoccaceae bacterium]
MSTLPALPYNEWVETKDTLHLFLQIIGKIRMRAHPKLNHWWHVTLFPHVRGLTTGRIPYAGGGFDILYDMLDHKVTVSSDAGRQGSFSVPGLTVAGFHDALFSRLEDLGISVNIIGVPYDNKSTAPFAEDTAPRAYDETAVSDFWRALCMVANVFETYRSGFVG